VGYDSPRREPEDASTDNPSAWLRILLAERRKQVAGKSRGIYFYNPFGISARVSIVSSIDLPPVGLV
jgi:hypothetical protein